MPEFPVQVLMKIYAPLNVIEVAKRAQQIPIFSLYEKKMFPKYSTHFYYWKFVFSIVKVRNTSWVQPVAKKIINKNRGGVCKQ